MDWTRFVLAILAAGFVSSMTDWFFGGILFHDKYLETPEVWRQSVNKGGEGKAVAGSIALGFLTAAVFAFVCARLNFHSYEVTLKLAVAVWMMVAVPILITNSLFMKLHPALVFSHSLGWLVKLAVCALAVILIMH